MFTLSSKLERFYRPTDKGIKMMTRGHRVYNNEQSMYSYQRSRPPDPKPFPEHPVNKEYSKKQIVVNPIRGIHGYIAQRNDQGKNVVPKGIANSFANFDEYMAMHFSDVECTLVLDSVLNGPTQMPMFLFPPDLSKAEIRNYLEVFYGMNNILQVYVRNFSGMRYKNEIGLIRKADALKAAWVLLDEPVHLDHKSGEVLTEEKAQ
ncbi:protein kinase [Perkinsela sp. CCAP 1560/4]|nr:protein kinase [Perkinsela sp. CCAP 1560/4]|eukprot:KNH07846.1 protein kinase [Perkinsela sp. CCAP 1560/4]